ncbi:response regulator transcription factor [Actinomadura oligospora]|uniref:response regulator transcription factor n=1 Tax=Actinomadura oligospora TaxID=111804 RepID=UPI0012FCC047|nr:response regulator transcription factor [Actinomadura oligospora]
MSGTPLLRHGLAELLGKTPGLLVVGGPPPGAARHATILIADAGDACPDPLIRLLLDRSPGVRVVVLADADDHLFLWKVLESGAHACLAKDVRLDELVSVIRAVHREGDRFVLSAPVGTLRKLRPVTDPGALTEREAEILRLVAAGMNNRHIAERLFVAEATVKRHLTNAYTKLGVTSRVQAVQKMRGSGLEFSGRRPDRAR